MLKGIAYLIVFAALLVPPKVALVERKGGSPQKAAKMRLVGILITTLITVGFYLLDLDNEREGLVWPSLSLFIVWLAIAGLVGYLAEMIIWRPLVPWFTRTKVSADAE